MSKHVTLNRFVAVIVSLALMISMCATIAFARGSDDECGHYFPGCTLISVQEGNTDVEIRNGIIIIRILGAVAGISYITRPAAAIINLLYEWNPAGTYQGMYRTTKYWDPDAGEYVYHHEFLAEDPNNPYAIMGLGCAVTNSPSLPAQI